MAIDDQRDKWRCNIFFIDEQVYKLNDLKTYINLDIKIPENIMITLTLDEIKLITNNKILCVTFKCLNYLFEHKKDDIIDYLRKLFKDDTFMKYKLQKLDYAYKNESETEIIEQNNSLVEEHLQMTKQYGTNAYGTPQFIKYKYKKNKSLELQDKKPDTFLPKVDFELAGQLLKLNSAIKDKETGIGESYAHIHSSSSESTNEDEETKHEQKNIYKNTNNYYLCNSTQIIFSAKFNQPLKKEMFPDSILYVFFGHNFNQSLIKGVFSSKIKQITFGNNFNQLLEVDQLPNSLRKIVFGINFNQPLIKGTFPEGIEEITFGGNFNQPLDVGIFPNSLKKINFGFYFNQILTKGILPEGIENIIFSWHYNHKCTHDVFPDSVKHIIINHGYIDEHKLIKICEDKQIMIEFL
jgi:hypothetical protein